MTKFASSREQEVVEMDIWSRNDLVWATSISVTPIENMGPLMDWFNNMKICKSRIWKMFIKDATSASMGPLMDWFNKRIMGCARGYTGWFQNRGEKKEHRVLLHSVFSHWIFRMEFLARRMGGWSWGHAFEAEVKVVTSHFPMFSTILLCCTNQTKVAQGLVLGKMIRMVPLS
jgi:hypothetical protein